MDALIFAQTFFYLAGSLTIIVLGALFAMMAFHIMKIASHLDKIAGNLDEASGEVKENVKEIIGKLSILPLLSFFFKKKENGKRIKQKKVEEKSE